MLIVKITVLLVVITAIFTCLVRIYLRGNPTELFRLQFDKHYYPWYSRIVGFLIPISSLGIISSVIYLLFLR